MSRRPAPRSQWASSPRAATRPRPGRRGDRPFGDVRRRTRASPPRAPDLADPVPDEPDEPDQERPGDHPGERPDDRLRRSHRSPSRAPIQVSAITQGSSQHRVDGEAPEPHPDHAGRQADEGADHREEASEEDGRLPVPLEPRGPGPPAVSTGIDPTGRSAGGRPSSRPSRRATTPRGCRACPRARPARTRAAAPARGGGDQRAAEQHRDLRGIGMQADSSSIRTKIAGSRTGRSLRSRSR